MDKRKRRYLMCYHQLLKLNNIFIAVKFFLLRNDACADEESYEESEESDEEAYEESDLVRMN